MFTRGDAGGNHLGVINDRSGLDTAAMQQIAADLGFSETVFVWWKEGEAPDVRIFTPTTELPFAGHPLVGTAWVMNHLGPGGVERLACGIGEVAVRLDGDMVYIDASMPQDAVTPVDDDLCLRAGLPDPVASYDVAMPLGYRLIEVASPGDVSSASPDLSVLAENFGTYLYARDGAAVRARFFAPSDGVPEDPATGSAAVALATALAFAGEPTGRLTIHQGEEIGFPSTIELSWSGPTASIGVTVRRDEVRLLDA